MCVKTKEGGKMYTLRSGFSRESAPLARLLTTMSRPSWQKMQKGHDKGGEGGTKIGSSFDRLIDPFAEHAVVVTWTDEPMNSMNRSSRLSIM